LRKGRPRNSAASARRTFCLTNAYDERPPVPDSGLREFLLLALILAAVATRRAAAWMAGNGMLGNLAQGGPERPYFQRR